MLKTSLLQKNGLFPTFHSEKPSALFLFSNMREGSKKINTCTQKINYILWLPKPLDTVI
jgi:hypothetical protein